MNIELSILDWIQTLHTPFLDKIMVFITRLGDVGIIWIVLSIVLLLIPKTRKSGAVMVAALVVDVVLCNIVLKNDYSFPSGHTAASFASVTALYLAGEKKLWKFALVLACLIAISRLYLYVHYPTDVLGGILFGVISGYLGYRKVLK